MPKLHSTSPLRKAGWVAGAVAGAVMLVAATAGAQQPYEEGVGVPPAGGYVQPEGAAGPPPEYGPPPDQAMGPEADPYGNNTLIPPNAEGAPYAAEGGGYCYVGPHPADTRVVPGPSWDATAGRHVRPYPPIDTRLFAFRDGCYYFVGDPRDFGYAGQTYGYYGAHPVLDVYGGGWCFMMGAHTHLWAPWSPYFTVVGPWYYWHGPYDPFFWAYWPYYSFYYRSYYPHYYGGGRFYRGGYAVAPPIRNVPPQRWRGPGNARAAPVVRGMPPTQMLRSAPAPSYAAPRAMPAPAYRTPPASPAPARPMAPARPSGGSFGTHGFHGGRR